MKAARIYAEKGLPVGEIDADVYSGFVEHLGRSVYEGNYEPDHPLADEDGFRKDVIEAIQELGVTKIRYPGGNFLSGYNWKNGIGPKEKRPVKLDLAWQTTESNQFGTDEFMKWCKKVGCEPMMAVNLGSGTPMEAAELVEYCNHAGKTDLTEQRKQNGSAQPYNVKLWCLGNEMDAETQIGHVDAKQYAQKAKEAAKLMRFVDKDLKFIVCGSCSTVAPTFPDWDREVLEIVYDKVDYLSLHQYFWSEGNNNDFFASSKKMNEYIDVMLAVCDYVKAKLRSDKTMMISFDEWNIWDIPQSGEANWKMAPHILEDSYTLMDAIVFASLMNTLINRCDRIKCACLAQLINVIAPIATQKGGGLIRQTTFYPFKMFSDSARGTAYHSFVVADKLNSDKHGEFCSLDACIVENPAEKAVEVFCCNFSDEDTKVQFSLNGFGKMQFAEHIVMNGDLAARNTFDRPFAVMPHREQEYEKNQDGFAIVLPKLSFNKIKFDLGGRNQ